MKKKSYSPKQSGIFIPLFCMLIITLIIAFLIVHHPSLRNEKITDTEEMSEMMFWKAIPHHLITFAW